MRTRFFSAGEHPLLSYTVQHLIASGLEYTCDNPDFVVVGAFSDFKEIECPTFVLSSSIVYSDLNVKRNRVGNRRAKEEDSLVIASPMEKDTKKRLQALLNENTHLNSAYPTMILRIFDVYGYENPSTEDSLISSMYNFARHRQPILIKGLPEDSGTQVRSILYKEDYITCMWKLLNKFIQGTQGIYNVGGNQELSLNNIAKDVWEFTNNNLEDFSICYINSGYAPKYLVPDITRTKAIAHWKPKYSIRNGIWTAVQSFKSSEKASCRSISLATGT